MAITTLDGVLAGMTEPQYFFKTGANVEGSGLMASTFYETPGEAAAPTPGIDGAALTTYAGQIPFRNPASGNSYLAGFAAFNLKSGDALGSVLLCDRLWHNSGIDVTSTSAQAITSPTWPARDLNGSTNGEGLLCGLEWSASGGSGTPTYTLGYTNSANTAGRTATFLGATTPVVGTFFRWPLEAGDIGIRSIQSIQLSATQTSGTAHMVVYRMLALLPEASYQAAGMDAVTSGMVRLYDNTVPFVLKIVNSISASNIAGQVVYTQG